MDGSPPTRAGVDQDPGRSSTSASQAGGVHALLLVVLGAAAYSNTFSVPFQFDDGRSIVENASVRDLCTFLSGPIAPQRAVAHLTFALNGSLGGTAPWGYHALNLAIHLAAALLVYALAALVCRTTAPAGSALHRRAPVAGLVAAALFVAHPLQTQAVTYVVQRMASLAALLYLATVWAYARAALEPDRRRRAAWYAAALASAALALFTKENAVTIPATLAALELGVLPGAERTLARRAARLAPFVLLTALAVAVLSPRATVQATSAQFANVSRTAAAVPSWVAYALTQPAVILSYLRLLVVPVGQNLDHDPAIASSLTGPVLLSIAALAAVLGLPTAWGWRARRTAGGRIALFAVAWFVTTMAVESSVLPIEDAMNEHRMYLPSAGLFLAAGCAVAWALERAGSRARRNALAVAVGAGVLVLAAATFARNQIWRDPLTLWGDAMAKSPGRSRPPIFVAQALIDRGDVEAAIPLLQTAMQLHPRTALADLNLGRAYAKLGRTADAERALRRGIALGGDEFPGAWLELANVLRDAGRIDEACDAYRAELKTAPGSREARSNLVVCSFVRGDAATAAAEADRLAREDPRDARNLFNLALATGALGDEGRAAAAYRRFLAVAGPELAPQAAQARQWLAERGVAAAPGP